MKIGQMIKYNFKEGTNTNTQTQRIIKSHESYFLFEEGECVGRSEVPLLK